MELAGVLAEAPLANDPVDQVDEIRALETLVCAAQARQQRLTTAYAESRDDPRGVAAEVALARRESPHRGRQHLGLALVAGELPHTMAAFRAGRVTEWRVMNVARETACLSLEDRAEVDRAIAADPDAFEAWSDREVLGRLRSLAARLDPASVAERRRRAESGRGVTIRPAPDTMVYLTALLPVADGVAAYATLCAEADRARATGDPRGRGQVMADALVARVTGCAGDDAGRPVVPVAIGVVMSDRTLLAGAHDPAGLVDHGPIPADLARELVLRNLDAHQRTWVRRLYARPGTGELVAMDSRRRVFPRALASFVRLRDQWCRRPWCNAPIRHTDHVVRSASGGPTSAADGQGLCESCNYTKESPGWHHQPRRGHDRHTVDITTPTGHEYRSTSPPLLVSPRPAFRQVALGRWVLGA
ncbi:HNH endonuclease [Nocardioides sp. cx-169]|uniref:HNH endonuclease n=1 Tax=Nocardioides sp. cx-169 TaxID=2899080 RepID=UPI001E3F93BC|nr:HNH endonuclease signature motif containing protein [Nocardioides sp. cx-169]MCD4533550.1 HNH endonuclease [Nocardioides sp. cx-169]